MPTAKWFSHQRDEAGVTDVGIQDQGYFDDPNAVMGSQTKRFSKGKYHIDEPVAKEQFSTSFYGEYLGESKASEGINSDRLSTDDGVTAFLEGRGASKYYIDYVLQFPDAPSVRMWKNHWEDGFLDFGGSFGTALFEGRIEDAYFNADGTNKANLQRMGLSFSSESKANERSDHDNSQDHDEDSDFKYHEWEIDEDFPEDVRCGICGASMSKSEYANTMIGLGESKANEDSIGSDIDFGRLLNETPYDEQQGRFRTARDEQSPLDNIYHSKSVADDIAGGTQDTYAQDFIGGSDGKALYDNYDDLDSNNWFYDSTGVKTNKLWESIAKEDLESEKKEWINAREELLKGNREPLLELVDRSGGDVELMKEVSVADALEQVDMEIDNFENYYTEAFESLTEESYRVD